MFRIVITKMIKEIIIKIIKEIKDYLESTFSYLESVEILDETTYILRF